MFASLRCPTPPRPRPRVTLSEAKGAYPKACPFAAHHLAAATRLEEYWNDLLRGTACSLFCAYPIDIYDNGDTAGLDAVLGSHTHMSLGPNAMVSSARGLR